MYSVFIFHFLIFSLVIVYYIIEAKILANKNGNLIETEFLYKDQDNSLNFFTNNENLQNSFFSSTFTKVINNLTLNEGEFIFQNETIFNELYNFSGIKIDIYLYNSTFILNDYEEVLDGENIVKKSESILNYSIRKAFGNLNLEKISISLVNFHSINLIVK